MKLNDSSLPDDCLIDKIASFVFHLFFFFSNTLLNSSNRIIDDDLVSTETFYWKNKKNRINKKCPVCDSGRSPRIDSWFNVIKSLYLIKKCQFQFGTGLFEILESPAVFISCSESNADLFNQYYCYAVVGHDKKTK